MIRACQRIPCRLCGLSENGDGLNKQKEGMPIKKKKMSGITELPDICRKMKGAGYENEKRFRKRGFDRFGILWG